MQQHALCLNGEASHHRAQRCTTFQFLPASRSNFWHSKRSRAQLLSSVVPWWNKLPASTLSSFTPETQEAVENRNVPQLPMCLKNNSTLPVCLMKLCPDYFLIIFVLYLICKNLWVKTHQNDHNNLQLLINKKSFLCPQWMFFYYALTYRI